MSQLAYPYESLQKVSRQDVARSKHFARSRVADDALFRAALSSMLGEKCDLHPEPLLRVSHEHLSGALASEVVACLLRAADPTDCVVFELEQTFAHYCNDRALGGDGNASSFGILNDVELGVLSHSIATAFSQTSSRYKLSNILQSPFAMKVALGKDDLWVWPYRISVGEHRFIARLWLRGDSRHRETSVSAARWPSLPVTMSLVAAEGRLSARECALLAVGDTVVLDDVYTDASGSTSWVRVRGSRRFGMSCKRVDEGLLMVEEKSSPFSSIQREGAVMPSEETGVEQSVAERVGDAPIELSIEIASFTVPLEDLNGLHPGQIIATGRQVGETVVLRSNTQAIATGELVDIEGELGIRLLALLDG